MTSPSFDQNTPQGGQPYGAPGQQPYGQQPYGQQPGPAPYGGGFGGPSPFGGAPGGQRPGQATAAAVVAIVWGSLGVLFGLLALSLSFLLGAIYGLIVLVSVAMSVALLVAGIFVLQGKSPKLLLLISYITIGVSVLSLVFSLAQNGGSAFSGLLGLVLPGVVVALLMQPQVKQHYASRGMAY